MNFGSKFGRLVRRYREAQGLSSGELAELAFGDTAKRSRISELENGRVARPHAKTIDALTSYLAIPIEEVDECREDPLKDNFSAKLRELVTENFGAGRAKATKLELEQFLLQSAEEWAAIRGRFSSVSNSSPDDETLWAEARQAIESGDVHAVDRAFEQLERKASENLDTDKIRSLYEINLLHADAELFLGNVDVSIKYMSIAVDYLISFDPQTSLSAMVSFTNRAVDKVTKYHLSKYFAAVSNFVMKTQALTDEPRFNFRDPFPRINAATMHRAIGSLEPKRSRGRHFQEARVAAGEALAMSETDDEMRMALNAAGLASRSLASVVAGDERVACLVDAIDYLNKAVDLSDPSEHRDAFVASNNNLGIAYCDYVKHVEPKERVDVILASGSAFNEAFQAVQKTPNIYLWLFTRNNLATSLLDWAKLVGGGVGALHAREASKICKDSLAEISEGDHPAIWVRIKTTLISSLTVEAEISSGDSIEEIANEADAVCTSLLEEDDVELDDHKRAGILKSRAKALTVSGSVAKMPLANVKLGSARRCYEEAVRLLKPTGTDEEVGSMLNDLAVIWVETARRQSGMGRFDAARQAVENCKNCLKVMTKQVDRDGWADTNCNLANAYVILAEESDGSKRRFLQLATSSLKLSLTVYTEEYGQRYRAASQNLAYLSQLLDVPSS